MDKVRAKRVSLHLNDRKLDEKKTHKSWLVDPVKLDAGWTMMLISNYRYEVSCLQKKPESWMFD